MEVCEGPDAEAVGGVKLGLEELAARVPHVCQLQQVGSGKQRLDIVLSHINLALYNVNTNITGLLDYCPTWLVYT